MTPDLTCPECEGRTYPLHRDSCQSMADCRCPRLHEWCPACRAIGLHPPTRAEWDALVAERDMWRQQYERERVRVGYVLGWLTPDSLDGDESKQHEYIAHMDTAAAIRSRLDSLRADLRDARAALDDAA